MDFVAFMQLMNELQKQTQASQMDNQTQQAFIIVHKYMESQTSMNKYFEKQLSGTQIICLFLFILIMAINWQQRKLKKKIKKLQKNT